MEGLTAGTRKTSQSSPSTSVPDFDLQELSMSGSMPMEWTDEKHSLYLKSMEASFVNQLYNSMDLVGMPSQNEKSDPKSSHQGQFKVLRGGCWQKINFQRHNSQVKPKETQDLLISPWIQHFKSRRKPQDTASAHSCATKQSGTKMPSCGKPQHHCYSCPHGLLDSNTEVSDQNFVDEVSEKRSKTCSSKRMRTQRTGSSTNDQVVPSGIFPVTQDATRSNGLDH